MSTALDVTGLLATAGQGTVGTDLFANEMPASPANCIAVFDVPSSPIVWAHGMNPVHQARIVQIQVRNVNPSVAASKAQACLTAMTLLTASANGRTYENIHPIGSASLLGRDDNGLAIFYGELECWLDLG